MDWHRWNEHGAPLGKPIAGHLGPIWSMELAPLQDRVVVTGGADGIARIWKMTAVRRATLGRVHATPLPWRSSGLAHTT